MQESEQGRVRSCVTVRSVAVGLVAVGVVCFWVTYGEIVLRGSRMNVGQFPMGLFIVFVALALGANTLARRVRPGWALRPGELAVVVAMGLVGSVAPASGIAGWLLGQIATPFYFASPENQWAAYVLPWVPNWLAPRDDAGCLTWFFEGLPAGQRVPWQGWMLPLAWWLALIAALAWVCGCVAVLLRRRWSAEERLSYPLLEPVRELSAEPASGRVAGVVRSPLFLIGAAVPLALMAVEVVGFFWPTFPTPQLHRAHYFYFARDFPPINTKVNFYTIGFAYFANLNVLGSVCFFYLLFVLEGGACNRLGVGLGQRGDPYGSYVFAGAGWQSYGAFLVLVLWGLWMARGHVARAVRNAFGRGSSGPGDEMLSDRTAVLGLLAGSVFVVFWLRHSGMSLGLAAFYYLLTLLTFIGVARIVCQTGLVYVQAPLTPQAFAMYSLGTATMSPASITALGFSYALVSYNRGFLMPAACHAAKLSEQMGRDKRRLPAAVGAALAVGLVLSVFFGLQLGYSGGAYHYGLPFTSARSRDMPALLRKLRNPFPADWARLSFFGAGAAAMGVLMALQYRFAWWPLHPIGLTVCCTNVTLDSVLSIFIAWTAKSIILRVGGVELYRRSRRFFIGLLVGQAVAVALVYLIDLLWFPGHGHQFHAW